MQDIRSGYVVQGEQRGWSFRGTKSLEKLRRKWRLTFDNEKLRLKSRLSHRLSIAGYSLTDRIEFAVVAYTENLPMAMLDEVVDGLMGAFAILHHHSAGIQIRKGPVEHHDRHAPGTQLPELMVRTHIRGYDENAGNAPRPHHSELFRFGILLPFAGAQQSHVAMLRGELLDGMGAC